MENISLVEIFSNSVILIWLLNSNCIPSEWLISMLTISRLLIKIKINSFWFNNIKILQFCSSQRDLS